RLNVDGVSPLQCILVQSPDGLMLRDLQSDGGTLVNGEKAANMVLHNGDLLTVGPFHFQVRVTESEGKKLAHTQARIEEEKKMMRRFQKHWGVEKTTLERREAEVAEQRRRLEQENERLQQDRAALTQARLRSNGDIELGRRQVQSGWDDLKKEQQRWNEQLD